MHTWSRRAESCAPIILIQLNQQQKNSSGENPREEPDKTRTRWKANHLDLSQQRDTFRKLQPCASFLPHMEGCYQLLELFKGLWKQVSQYVKVGGSFWSKYESGVSYGQPGHFKPDHYTNNSVYADYRCQFSLSDFLYVAGPIKFSLWLQLKEQKSSPGRWPRSRAVCSGQSPQAVSQTQFLLNWITISQHFITPHLPNKSIIAHFEWIGRMGVSLFMRRPITQHTNYSPAVSQPCLSG